MLKNCMLQVSFNPTAFFELEMEINGELGSVLAVLKLYENKCT